MLTWEVVALLLLGGLIVLFVAMAMLDWPTIDAWLRQRIHR